MGGKRRPHLSSFPDNIEINVCHQTTGFRGRPFSNVEPYIWALLHCFCPISVEQSSYVLNFRSRWVILQFKMCIFEHFIGNKKTQN